MNAVANWITFIFLVSHFSFNGNAQNLQFQDNKPGPNQVAGGGVQGQGYDPNQNQVAGGGGKVKGNIQMEKITVSKFFKLTWKLYDIFIFTQTYIGSRYIQYI